MLMIHEDAKVMLVRERKFNFVLGSRNLFMKLRKLTKEELDDMPPLIITLPKDQTPGANLCLI